MSAVQIRIKQYKELRELSKQVPLDMRLGEAREAMQTLLLLSENTFYYLGLARTGKILEEQLTFYEAGIEQNDQITLILPEELKDWNAEIAASVISQSFSQHSNHSSETGNSYKLILTTSGNTANTWEYSINLREFYENEPSQFFNDENQKERKRLETSLSKLLAREIQSREIDKIVQEWCTDIAKGYRATTLKIQA
jgi:hypothetical protein